VIVHHVHLGSHGQVPGEQLSNPAPPPRNHVVSVFLPEGTNCATMPAAMESAG
jgi:hypothetical protein